MYQKFIITQDGELRFGHVYLHRDLLHPGESCPYGGGIWKVDEARHAFYSLAVHSTSAHLTFTNSPESIETTWAANLYHSFTSPAGLTTKLKFPLVGITETL